MDEGTRSALMAAAWQTLERNEGWNGSKEDFARYWEQLEPSMEAAIYNEATKAKWDMWWEAVKKYSVAALLSIPVILRLLLSVGALVLTILLINRLMV